MRASKNKKTLTHGGKEDHNIGTGVLESIHPRTQDYLWTPKQHRLDHRITLRHWGLGQSWMAEASGCLVEQGRSHFLRQMLARAPHEHIGRASQHGTVGESPVAGASWGCAGHCQSRCVLRQRRAEAGCEHAEWPSRQLPARAAPPR